MNDHEKSRFLCQVPTTATPLQATVRSQGHKLLWTLILCLVGAALLLSLNHAPLANAMPLSQATPTSTPAPNARINGSDCNLIDAITAANTDTATGSCAAGNPGADTIQLLSDVRLTIVLNPEISGGNGLPVITSPITINGNGHTIARDASALAFRILRVDATGIVTLNATTITGGVVSNDLGGGILNLGTLTLSNSTVSGNTGGAGGGGIHNGGTLTLSNSTVSGNITAISGGGIFNARMLTLSNSTVSSNTAVNGGGGIHNGGTLILNNSTVSGNSTSGSGGGIYNDGGTLTLSNSTVSGNTGGAGGGIINGGTLTLERSLIAGNQAPTAAEIDHFAGPINSNNYNLFGHNGKDNTQAFAGFTPGSSDITATSDGTRPTPLTNILNTTLATNGGGTLTHALVAGSPAMDAAPDGPTTDQRGVARPQGAAFDIGAFELVLKPPVITIALDMQPDSKANVKFTAGLGTFTLDDIAPQDSDVYTNTKRTLVAPGTYTIQEQNLNGWFVTDIACTPAAKGVVDLVNRQVTINTSPNDNITCTFVTQRAGKITAGTYNDRNHNHNREGNEAWLSGWTMELYSGPTTLVATQVTTTTGRITFANLRPGLYTLCEVLQSGWYNITPHTLDPVYAKPCYPVRFAPGQAAAALFGNSTTPLVAGAEVGDFNDVVLMELPDTDDEGNEVTPLPNPWPDAPAEGANTLFLPLVTR